MSSERSQYLVSACVQGNLFLFLLYPTQRDDMVYLKKESLKLKKKSEIVRQTRRKRINFRLEAGNPGNQLSVSFLWHDGQSNIATIQLQVTVFWKRQSMYVWRNTEPLSYNHCYSGTAKVITYCECVFVALGIQNAMRMSHIAICGLTCSTIFFYIIS